MTNEHLVPDWEKELDKENWHAIEGGNGRCACGSEQGICHTRLKSFIRSLLGSHHAHLKERVWDLEILENGYGEMFVKLADVKKLLE